MATVEQFVLEGLSATLGGQQSVRRKFLTDLSKAAAEAIISNNGSIPGVPRRGEIHPYLPRLYVQSHSVEDVGNGFQSFVYANYGTSNMSALQYARPDVTGSNFYRGSEFTEELVTIPYAVAATVTYSANGTQESKAGWQVRSKQIAETRRVKRVNWRLPFLDESVEQAFENQNDKIHEIQGRKYLFQIGRISAIDNDNFEVSASWLYDPGTPAGPLSSSPTKFLTAGDLPILHSPTPGFLRLPFHQLQTVPAADPTQDLDQVAAQPFLLMTPMYEEDLNGWQTLPFIPSL